MMSQTAPDRPDEETLHRVKRAVTARLLAMPGVNGVGLGAKRVGGKPIGLPAIKVFVSAKVPAAQVPPGDLIPSWIDGVPTDVEEGLHNPTLLTGQCTTDPRNQNGALGDRAAVDKGTVERPLIGGAKLTAEGQDAGTLGCLMWDPDNHDVGYILTCQHLFGKTTPIKMGPLKGKLKIGQPDFVDTTCHHELVGRWLDGNLEDGLDAAVIKLFPGMTFKAEILGIGPVRGIYNLKDEDRNLGTYPVMKRGHATGLTGGTILADNVVVRGLHSHPNLFLIEPNGRGGHGPGERIVFGASGDSGSAIVNEACQVVGLLFAIDKSGNGLARPIGTLLSRLQALPDMPAFEVAAEKTPTAPEHRVPGGSTVAVPREVAAQMAADPEMSQAFLGAGGRAPVGAPWFVDVPLRPGQAENVFADLDRSAAGRSLVELWREHRAELAGLLYQDRRLMLVWQRQGGSALIQLLLRMVAHPDKPLPVTLHGEPLMACLHKVSAELRRCASPELSDGFERLLAIAPDLAGLDYQGILDALAAASASAEEAGVHE